MGSQTHALRALPLLGVAPRRVRDSSVVLRVADAVITDDSDEAVDFLLTGRPLLHYLPSEASSTTAMPCYPPAAFMAGPACSTFEELEASLESVFDEPSPVRQEAYRRAATLAFAYTDDLSGWRLVERIRRQYVT